MPGQNHPYGQTLQESACTQGPHSKESWSEVKAAAGEADSGREYRLLRSQTAAGLTVS